MLITDILTRNAHMYTNETALVERAPAIDLRREITWKEFDHQADRTARALMALGIQKGDKVIHLMVNSIEWLPIYFGILKTGAKMHWFGNFIVGAKAVILKGIEPKWIIEAVSEEKVTLVWLLVPWALDILFAVECGDLKLGNYDLDQWRLMHIGAQPVPVSLIKEWKKIFPHHQYDTNYGLTECTGPGCVHLGVENEHKVGAIGRPGFDWESKVVDDDLNLVDPGSPGELMVKGPGIMKEYYKNPEATSEAIVDGWLRTGDVARQDEDGFIWLVDRKKDVIITGGENIYPVEIENFLQAHPKIQDVAVIGVPSTRLGEITAAVIQIVFSRDGMHPKYESVR